MRRSITLFWCALTVPLVACGDNAGEQEDPGAWVAEYVQSLCAKAHECRSAFPINTGVTFEHDYGASVAACQEKFTSPSEARTAVSSGHALYDGDRGGSCLSMLNAQYAAQTCEAFWADNAEPAQCSDVFVGLLAEGAACAINFECASQNCILANADDALGVCGA